MSTPADTSGPDISVERLDEAFEGPIKRVWRSPLYPLGLLIVAAVMVVLPLIYIGLIGLTGYGLFHHATENIAVLGGEHGRSWRVGVFRVVVYLAPLVIGGILLVFMVKPLFARTARSDKRISFLRENEPVLFAFVDRLCETVRAAKPRRIDVNCEINASASFRRGFLSFLGGDLVLTIGAPLVAGMTLRQFAGILAHELGHFTQGFGMRMGYIVYRVNNWFARVVYERDVWDEKLIELSRTAELRVALIFLLARFFVWVTRKILWLLMFIGHTISCGMSRQMEYDADRYQVRVVGSDIVKASILRVHLLYMASEAVHAELAESWKDGRLGDNFSALLIAKVDEIPRTAREKIRQRVEKSKTSLFDTHPSDAARIRRAEKEQTPGIFRAKGPASALFNNFDALCRNVSFFYYQDMVGSDLSPKNLISTEAVIHRHKETQQGELAAERYFQGCLTVARPLNVDRHSQVFKLSPKQCLGKLKQARTALGKSMPVIRKLYKRYFKADEKLQKVCVARTLLRAGVRIDPKDFELPSATIEQALRAENQVEQVRRDVAEQLAKIEAVLTLRLECALALLRVDQVARRIKGADKMRRRSDELLDALTHIHALSDSLTDLRKELRPLYAMNWIFDEETDPDEAVMHQAAGLVRTQHEQLSEIRRVLSNFPYPFEHAGGRITMACYAIDIMPASDELTGTMVATERLMDNMNSLYIRVMGELSRIAEGVEAAVGLPTLGADTAKQAVATRHMNGPPL
ncbi:MAG: M48 family metalloprotease [Phycisphaerae bacterium]|nr:M48 family metalloprotease [Phycisphaerae bacterium]